MALKKLLLAASLFLFIGTLSYGQSATDSQQLIESIQSIAKSNKLDKASVNYLSPISFYNKLGMETKTLTRVREFRFEGQFLVIEDSYFNIDKLAYFTLKKGFIDFYFQVY